MSTINMGRVILGGIVAGIVIDIVGYLESGLLLANRWNAAFAALGKGSTTPDQTIWYLLAGIG